MMSFKIGSTEVTFPSSPPIRPPDLSPLDFRMSRRGRPSRIPSRPPESRPLVRARSEFRGISSQIGHMQNLSSSPPSILDLFLHLDIYVHSYTYSHTLTKAQKDT